MKTIQLLTNEYLWSKEGTHVCDDQGFAIKAESDCEIEIEDEHHDRVLKIITEERARNTPVDSAMPAEEAPKALS